MSEPVNAGGIADTETALQREIDLLAQRFPHLERSDLEQRVRDTYDQLKRDATVEAHLIAVTRARVTQALRDEGVQLPGHDTD